MFDDRLTRLIQWSSPAHSAQLTKASTPGLGRSSGTYCLTIGLELKVIGGKDEANLNTITAALFHHYSLAL